MSEETGVIRKDPGGRLNLALVFPNTFFVGMSNLGLHAMYRAFNDEPAIVAERFFLDSDRSMESSRPLQDFHIIAFSVSYELDWINMVRMLRRNSIPLRSKDRKGWPLVMAGGSAATINPEPMADALDLVFLGEGEPLAAYMAQAFAVCSDREDFIEQLHGVPGIYVPCLTRPVYEGEKIREFSGPRPVISIQDPFTMPAHTVIQTDKTVFQDMFLTEIARGCPFHCKFCTAREIYSPFRPLESSRLDEVIRKAAASGKKIGLVSTSLNNHPQLHEILSAIAGQGLKIAPPSLRLGMISGDLLDRLQESRVNGVTLAPEVGSGSLRKALGKTMSNDTIMADITALVSRGIRDIKLYFMVGVPGEELSDIDAIIELVKHVRQVFIQVSRGNKKIGTIQLSVNAMVPKPHSAYERSAMLDPGEAKQRIRRIASGLRSQSNVTVSFEGPKWAYLQALIARGDRRVLEVIDEMAGHDPSQWHGILKKWPRNPDYYALREHDADEVLPWSFYTVAGPSTCRGGE